MRLQWFPQYQFAGYIVAKVKGYYEEAGLDVTINPAGPGVVSLPLVASGSDTFGSTGADTVLIAREKGIGVVSLATWFQSSPVGFMVHSDSGIVGPRDFVGRSVGMSYGDNVETEYRALMAAAGVDRTQVNEVKADVSLAPFLTRQVDVWPVYVTDQPNQARQQGADVRVILGRDSGVQLLGDVLFTSESFLRQNPNTVRAFVHATLRGWEYALNNQDETVQLLADYNRQLTPEQLTFEGSETIKLVRYGAGANCPGWHDLNVWQAEGKTLTDLAILNAAPDLTTALNNSFVASYYQGRGVTCP
jgi:ABC-type nitrate/sulfonate/bicarbonate transport system substrate-binding protein